MSFHFSWVVLKRVLMNSNGSRLQPCSIKGLPFEATLPATTITRAEAKNAFYQIREQAADVPEMSLDEINAEISAVRAERKR